MRIFIIFIAFLPPIIATPAFPQRQRAETGTNEITAPKNNFKPFGDQPFGDQPFGEQPFGVWPWESDELDPPASSTDPINLPPLQDSGDTGIYAPPTKPWGCPPDRSFPLCCDGKPYGDDVQTGCSAWDGKLLKCNIMLDQFCCGYYYKLVGVGQNCKNIFDFRTTRPGDFGPF